MDAKYWIEKLQLVPHPEGGYYKETYRSEEEIIQHGFDGKRNINTAIYFLLEGKDKSHFHRIKSDELWFFHEGNALEIYVLKENKVEVVLVGKNMDQGESLQAIVPAGNWFGARIKDGDGFALVSCTVAPGFDFKDFELGNKENLLMLFPKHKNIIEELSF